MKKILISLLCVMMVFCMMPGMAFAEGEAVGVSNFDGLKTALANGGNIKLTSDITTTEALVTSGVTATIDLDGKTLTIGAGDNKFNDATNLTIQNGNIVITGVTVSGNAIFCLDEYEETLATTLTLNNVNLTGNGYSSAYGVFYIGKSSVLNVAGGEWNLANDTHASGGVFKADGSGAVLNISGTEMTLHNVRRVVTYAATTIEDSTMAISGDADGVDAEMEHGFNRSPLTITDSTITMKDMVGRGITAENGAVKIEGTSTVTITNAQEATIDVRNGQTVTVESTADIILDKEPTITSGKINGNTTVPINNVDDLKVFRDDVNSGNTYAGKTVKLYGDIDLGNEEWIPIGNSTTNFQGTFDGQNYTISNLTVNMPGKSNAGFFGMTTNGEIKNLTVNNAKVTGRLNVGVVAGTPYTTKYTNIKVTGHVEVDGMSYVGGVGGKNAYANWTDIIVDVDGTSYVKADSVENEVAYRTYVGGVIGFNGEGGHTFKNITSNIKVIGSTCDIGGIFGILHYNNKVENVTCTADVTSTGTADEIGGIAGVWHNENGTTVTMNDVTYTGTVSDVNGTVENCDIVGGAYKASNSEDTNSGSLIIDNQRVWPLVAEIGDVQYGTLQAAFDAAKDGDTITLLCDITISKNTAAYDDGTYVDGVRYNGDKNFTVDFGGYTVTDDGCVNDYLIYINNKGIKANEITFTNGTVVSKNGCWATVCVGADSSPQKTVLNLDNMKITNSNGAGYSGNQAVRVRGSESVQTTINVNSGTEITSKDASYGIACSSSGSIININDGATVTQMNSSNAGGNHTCAAVGGKGIVNVYDGASIISDTEGTGIHTMTTGTPVVNIYGGTITAEGVALKASTNGGIGELSTINVYGGEITGTLDESNSDSRIFVSGGKFSVDPAEYCVDGYQATKSNSSGLYYVSIDPGVTMVAQINDSVKYKSLQAAVEAAQNSDIITLLTDIELAESFVIDKAATFTIDGNGHKIIPANGYTDKQNGLLLLGATTYGDAETATHNYTLKNIVFEGTEDWSVIRSQGITLTVDGCTIQNCNQTNGQALLRLDYTEGTIKNITIKNNDALMAITHNFNGDSSNTKLTVEECVIENNTFNKTAAIYYVCGGGCVINDSEFINNDVNCTNNGAIVYLGFQEDCAVTGCLFKDNDVVDSSTSTRVAGAIFFGNEAEIAGNAFVNNTATNANGSEGLGQDICTSTYYECTIDLSGNYFDGAKPVEGVDYFIQHKDGDAEFVLDDYYTTYGMDADGNVVLSGKTSTKPAPEPEAPTYTPSVTIQKPVVESAENATVTLGVLGTTATITVAEGYELVDVTVNGVSKGAVTSLSGLKTGDTVVVTTKPIEAPKTEAELVQEQLDDMSLVARSKRTAAPSGKNSIMVYWYDKAGAELDFDGVEIFRSTKKSEGFKKVFTSKTDKYYNTAIEEGVKYYYKVRGYVTVDGEKLYTDWSLKAIRTAK